jgi:hypothetical protein
MENCQRLKGKIENFVDIMCSLVNRAANIFVCDVTTSEFVLDTNNRIWYFILLHLKYFRGVQICAKGRGNNNDLDRGITAE